MLDLTAQTTKLYEIKLLDGQVLELKRPTQAMQETTLKLNGLGSNNAKEVFTILLNLFARILNRNEQGIQYKEKELAENYDVALMTTVIKDYFDYWNTEIQDTVNFQVAQ